jgi:hypothetical protein
LDLFQRLAIEDVDAMEQEARMNRDDDPVAWRDDKLEFLRI